MEPRKRARGAIARQRALSEGGSGSEVQEWLHTFNGWEPQQRERALVSLMTVQPGALCRRLVDLGTGRLLRDIIHTVPPVVAERALSWMDLRDLAVASAVSWNCTRPAPCAGRGLAARHKRTQVGRKVLGNFKEEDPVSDAGGARAASSD